MCFTKAAQHHYSNKFDASSTTWRIHCSKYAIMLWSNLPQTNIWILQAQKKWHSTHSPNLLYLVSHQLATFNDLQPFFFVIICHTPYVKTCFLCFKPVEELQIYAWY